MPFFHQLTNAARWLVLSILVGILAGSASALLIVLLNWATATRDAHPWIIALLPVAGLGVGLMYHFLGRSVEAGNNLIVQQIHADADDARATIPFRMTPLILIGTGLTHPLWRLRRSRRHRAPDRGPRSPTRSTLSSPASPASPSARPIAGLY